MSQNWIVNKLLCLSEPIDWLETMSAKRKSFPNKISSQIDDQMKIDEEEDDDYPLADNKNHKTDKQYITGECVDTDNDDEAEPEDYRLNGGADVGDNGLSDGHNKLVSNNEHNNNSNKTNNNYLLMTSEMSNTDSEYESESSGHSSKSVDERRKINLNKRSIDEVLNRLNKNNNHFKQRSVHFKCFSFQIKKIFLNIFCFQN